MQATTPRNKTSNSIASCNCFTCYSQFCLFDGEHSPAGRHGRAHPLAAENQHTTYSNIGHCSAPVWRRSPLPFNLNLWCMAWQSIFAHDIAVSLFHPPHPRHIIVSPPRTVRSAVRSACNSPFDTVDGEATTLHRRPNNPPSF